MTFTFEETARTATVDGFEITYNQAGDPDRPTLVMLHGGGAGATGWGNFAANSGAVDQSRLAYQPAMTGRSRLSSNSLDGRA